MEAVEKLQALVYEEVPVARTGDMFIYDIFSPRVQGISSSTLLNFNKLWNVWSRK
jgi:hypothetical protein